MRKWILLLACLPVFWLAACSDDDEPGPVPPPATEEPEELMGSETRKLLRVLEVMDKSHGLDRGRLVITDEQYDEIAAFTDNLVAGKTGDAAYEAIFNWIVANVEFVYNSWELESNDPYDVFTDKRAVCQGFCNLLKTMCLTQDMPCLSVNGYMYPNTEFPMGHAWNYVWTGERWIVSDATNHRDWDMVDDVAAYSYEVEPEYINEPLAEDDNFVYSYYRGLNVSEVKATTDTVRMPDAVLGFYVTTFNPSVLPASAKVIVLNARAADLGNEGSEGLRNSFAGANVESILVADGNRNFESYEGVLYGAGDDLPLVVPGAMRVVHLKAASFGKNEAVFLHDSVEEIYFAEGTASIGAYAVENCPSLKVVHVPASAVIEEGAFPAGVTVEKF